MRAAWGDAGVPTMAVTWELPHADLAAVVMRSSGEHLQVRAYNFRRDVMRAGMRLWRLRPGEYAVRRGPVLGTGTYGWGEPETFTLPDRAGLYHALLPARKDCIIDFRLIKAFDRPLILPDPACAPRDVAIIGRPGGMADLAFTVHNLGSARVKGLKIALVDDAESGRVVRVSKNIDVLPACKDLRPSAVVVSFPGVKVGKGLKAVIDPYDEIVEICESNNLVSITRE